MQNQLVDARAATPRPVYFRPSSRPSRVNQGASLFGAIAGILGFCAGGGAALIAMLPSSALWTSRIICGAPNQLMINTSHYSYKPNQSGTTVEFECLKADGVYEANFLAISALQAVLIAMVLAAVAAVVIVLRRRSRRESVRPPMMLIAGAFAVAAAVIVGFVASQTFSTASKITQMPPGGSLFVDGNAQSKNIACHDGHLTVDGREMTVIVTGHCASIAVDGVIKQGDRRFGRHRRHRRHSQRGDLSLRVAEGHQSERVEHRRAGLTGASNPIQGEHNAQNSF